jgi:hypothetical protein
VIKTESNLPVNSGPVEQEQQNHRLQLLAQAIEKVENEKRLALASPTLPTPMASPELLLQLFGQQNVAAVMAAAAAVAAAQLKMQQNKAEPISPPSTSSASSTSLESPLDFSSRRSIDERTDTASPNQPLLTGILPNSSSSNANFPLLLTNKNGKPTRPFKAYPRDPLMLPLAFCSTEQSNDVLSDVASRMGSTRKRLAQTSDRFKHISSRHLVHKFYNHQRNVIAPWKIQQQLRKTQIHSIRTT